MANIKVIAEHSVDVSLLSSGLCIDVGCRGFEFSRWMYSMGCAVWAFDLEEMTPPEGIEFIQEAVTTYNGVCKYVDTMDLQAKYIDEKGAIEIPCVALNYLYEKSRPSEIDVLKLDCEGQEYFLLSDENFTPRPKQISVEFHMHCHHALHDQYYDKCMENLLKYYEPVHHELTQAHGAGWNYWNSLFVRRDLL